LKFNHKWSGKPIIYRLKWHLGTRRWRIWQRQRHLDSAKTRNPLIKKWKNRLKKEWKIRDYPSKLFIMNKKGQLDKSYNFHTSFWKK